MSELELLNLCRSVTANEVTMFGEVIAINFAMVVAIYYFLHQARLPIRLFAFFAYSVGVALYLGEMLIEGNLKFVALAMMRELPLASTSAITKQYIGVNASWLGITTTVLFNGAFYVLWIGVFYLLFFWKKLPGKVE